MGLSYFILANAKKGANYLPVSVIIQWKWMVLCMLIFIGKPYLWAQQASNFQPASLPSRIIMSIQENPYQSRTITWWTDTSVQEGYIQYLLSNGESSLLDAACTQTAQTNLDTVHGISAAFHAATLRKLLPNSVYVYRVGHEKYGWSEWFQFKTPKLDSTFSFLYLGDAQNDMHSLWSRAIRGAYSENTKADFVIHAGDMVDRSDRNEEWGQWFAAGSWVFAKLPQILAPGNHEYVRNPEHGDSNELNHFWRNAFSLPANGPEGLEEICYFLDYKNTRFIVLDTRDMLINDEHSQIQVRWLEQVLKDNPQKWTIVVHHHPVFSARGNRGDYPIRDFLEPLYKQYQVDLVLQGHHHSFARGRSADEVGKNFFTGPVYFVSNSGPKMYDTNFAPWMERVATNVQMYHDVSVTDDCIHVQSFLVNGQLYDDVIIKKNANGQKTMIEKRVNGVKERIRFSTASYGADIDTSAASKALFHQRAVEYLLKRLESINGNH